MAVPIEVCEARDPKGLYKTARAGLIKNFTGEARAPLGVGRGWPGRLRLRHTKTSTLGD